MKPEEKNVEEVLKQYWSSASQEEAEADCNRVLHRLRATAKHAANTRRARSGVLSFFGTRMGMVSVAAAVLLAVVQGTSFVQRHRAIAVIEKSSTTVAIGEIVRANSDGSTLILSDGSRVEMRAQSELLLERAEDGLRIHLRNGSIIVNAAKQRKGHLYVVTKDVTVSVVGTVFLVNAEEEGSRVGVIEGEVRVQVGATEKKLRPGDQATTNPAMESAPLKSEVAWSLHAEAHVALLEQASVGLLQQATVAPKPAELPVAFEVESVRRSSPPPAGGRGGPAGPAVSRAPCSGPAIPLRVEIDPHRFAASGATLRALAMSAYGKSCLFLSGGPDWMESDRFDIEAVIPEGSESYTVQQFRNGDAQKLQVMLQNLLAHRFKLSLHPVMKDMEVYNLVVVNAGKMKPAEGPQNLVAASAPRLVPTIHARLTYRALTELFASLLGRPVIDKTELTGLFDVHLEWALDLPVPGAAPGTPPPGQSAIFSAIQDQLGLKLEPARALVEILQVDHAEKPSEN